MGLGKWICNPASNYDDYLNDNNDHGCTDDNDHHHCRANNNNDNHHHHDDDYADNHGCAYDQFFLVCSIGESFNCSG